MEIGVLGPIPGHFVARSVLAEGVGVHYDGIHEHA